MPFQDILEQRGYSSLSDLITEIDDKINGINAPAGLKDKVTVSASGSNIRFTPVSGSGISTLSLTAVSGNTGYKDLFVGTNTTYTERTAASSGTNARSPQITLDIPIGTVIDSSNDTFVVVVDGESKSVKLDHGEITADNTDGIIDAINNALGLGDTITYNRTFTNVNVSGSGSHSTSSAVGGVTISPIINTTVYGTGIV